MKITDKFIEPSPSATVLLIRDSSSGPEVFLVLRRKEASFGASYVFPGGVIDPVDNSINEYFDDRAKNLIDKQLDLSSDGFSYLSAAIRELFEEAGILYAKSDKGELPKPHELQLFRDQLNSKSLSWSQFLKENKLRLCHKDLIYFAFWITPLYLSRRYTTRFFCAKLPKNQIASHCGNELINSCWLSPKEALLARRKKDISIPHPTAITLMQIRGFANANEIIEWARQKLTLGVPCYFPELTTSELKGDFT